MRGQRHERGARGERQGRARVAEAWAMEVGPRLPAPRAEQALALQALQRGRSLATPHDRLRGGLASVLGPLSTRRGGAWAGLVGGAERAAAAWRKRLRARRPGLRWLLSALGATSEVPAPLGGRRRGRLRLGDASGLGPPGGTGDDWRWPLASDLPAGRRGQGQDTARRGGEHLGRDPWPAGAVLGADRGEGERRRVARAVRQQAEVGLRLPPATVPLATDAGQPGAVLRWLRQRGETARDWHGWWRWQGQRSRVRRLAAQLEPSPARKAAAPPQSAAGRARHHGAHAGRGRWAPREHHPVGGDLVAHRRAVPVSGALARGARVAKNAATAAAQPETASAPHAGGSHGAGPADGLGVAGRPPDVAAPPGAPSPPAGADGGEPWAAPWAGARHAAAAGAGQLGGGPSPGVPPAVAPLALSPSTAPGASGNNRARLAGTTSLCPPRQTA
jgi:hypothetical protein